MRPQSIRRFDLFYLGSLAVSAFGFFLSIDTVVAQVAEETAAAGFEMGSGVVWGSFLFGMAISLLLWFLVSHKAFGIVRWIIVALFAFSLRGLPLIFSGPLVTTDYIALLAMALEAISIWYLFQPDAREWFGRERAVETAEEDPVFPE